MVKGLGILFALFVGLPVWAWIMYGDPHAHPPLAGYLISLVVIPAFFYVVGAITGFAIRKVRAG